MKSLPKFTGSAIALVAAVYWLTGTSLLGFQQPVGKGQVTVLKPDSVPRERSADAPGAESPEARPHSIKLGNDCSATNPSKPN